jgi:hypothetical protein
MNTENYGVDPGCEGLYAVPGESGPGTASGYYEDEGTGAGVGSGDGWGDSKREPYPLEATYGDEYAIADAQQTPVTLAPGVYVVTQETPIILPRGTHLVTPSQRIGRGSGSGNGAATIVPDEDEGLITPSSEEATQHAARVPGGVLLQSGDGSGMGRGAS